MGALQYHIEYGIKALVRFQLLRILNPDVQGLHDKSAQKEFLSHTLKNEVISLFFLYCTKIMYRRG